MPALIGLPGTQSAGSGSTTTKTALQLKKQQQQEQQLPLPSLTFNCTSPFDLPELCDQIAAYLDLQTLTVVVRVCSQWYGCWIRHLWRKVQVSTSVGSLNYHNVEMQRAFGRMGGSIRHLEWMHQSNDLFSEHLLKAMDLSGLNTETLLLSNWTKALEASTLDRFVHSSAPRLKVLQLHNIAAVRGDLIKVAATSLPNLRHFSLTMAEPESSHSHSRQRSGVSTPTTTSASSSGTSTPAMVTELAEFSGESTSAESLMTLLDACPKLRALVLQDVRTPLLTLTATEDNEDSNEEDIRSEPPQTPFFRPMQYLTSINLHATTLSGLTLSGLFSRCPQLAKLDLGQDSALFLSGFHLDSKLVMKSLSVLHMGQCHFLDGAGFKEIMKASPSLRMVDISQSSVDDAALAVLGRQCQEITDLNLDKCTHITDQGVRDMLSHSKTSAAGSTTTQEQQPQEPYRNYNLQSLSIAGCTELTGQGIHHILMTCARLRTLDFQQPEIMPEALFPHTLETVDEDEVPTNQTQGQEQDQIESLASSEVTPVHQETTSSTTAPLYPGSLPASIVLATGLESALELSDNEATAAAAPWACSESLELLSIKRLNTINPSQTQFLNARLRELSHLKVLHIGGSQLELSVLLGLSHRLEHLYIDDLAREVDLKDVQWLVDQTPKLTRLWCRQLIRHSEPWKMLRGARKQLKLW
ncbi:hypothetical protein EMPS_02656 [Entomortierella parvispora]|uniref:F-box/LRR-repeat protein 15-like leucin rich repeat domain-containing protein n=1 Tax=Entomortierella parvispora TaxID=205924 RepID=A0A9P3H5T7_9FUNG|nr:hypothetical protein EMPS_02656 [Entomortierella parvispora]